MKKNTRKHTHIPKPKKVKKFSHTLSESMKNMNKILTDSEKKKQTNMNKMYDILQEQMIEYLQNLEEKSILAEKEEIKLTPDEKIKEFSDMLRIFTKYESLTRKLESHIGCHLESL